MTGDKTQQSVEQHLEKLPLPDEGEETTYEEAFGPMEDWIITLENHQIMLDPLIRKWFFYDRVHDEWAATGIRPGQATFVVVENKLGVKINRDEESQPDEILEAATVMRPKTAYALIINSPNFPDPIPITGDITIGRGKTNQIMLADEQASRQHARILWDGVVLQAEDLDTTNGTEVNNIEIKSPTMLSLGDIVTVGDTNIKIITMQDGETA